MTEQVPSDPRDPSKLVGEIWRGQIADSILVQIIHDLRLINRAWAELDVDVRNEQIRLWREKIKNEVKTYG